MSSAITITMLGLVAAAAAGTIVEAPGVPVDELRGRAGGEDGHDEGDRERAEQQAQCSAVGVRAGVAGQT